MRRTCFFLGAVSLSVLLSSCASGPSTPLPPESTSPGFQMPDNGFKAPDAKKGLSAEEEESEKRARP